VVVDAGVVIFSVVVDAGADVDVVLDAPEEQELTIRTTASKHKIRTRVRVFINPPNEIRPTISHSQMGIRDIMINGQ
jgi:hypothetical protein